EADAEFARFNASFRFDRRLLDADIEGSRAQAEALQAAGILSRDEADRINDGLDRVLERARTDAAYLDSRDAEDVHSFVEAELVAFVGDAGYKLHTGRSRNDQVATDLRLFLRAEIDRTLGHLRELNRALLDLAEV